jgi:hypothetical protein
MNSSGVPLPNEQLMAVPQSPHLSPQALLKIGLKHFKFAATSHKNAMYAMLYFVGQFSADH